MGTALPVIASLSAPSRSMIPPLRTRLLCRIFSTLNHPVAGGNAVDNRFDLSQIMAKMETSGSDAIRPPSPGLRLATSDTATMMIPDKTALTSR
jgi:hypothetical protein